MNATKVNPAAAVHVAGNLHRRPIFDRYLEHRAAAMYKNVLRGSWAWAILLSVLTPIGAAWRIEVLSMLPIAVCFWVSVYVVGYTERGKKQIEIVGTAITFFATLGYGAAVYIAFYLPCIANYQQCLALNLIAVSSNVTVSPPSLPERASGGDYDELCLLISSKC